MIQALFFDIDGTLLTHESGRIPASALAALDAARARGIKLFVNTGRHPENLADVKRQYAFDGYLCMNSQYCVAEGQLIHDLAFTRGELETVARVLRDWALPVWFFDDRDMYILGAHPFIVKRCGQLGIPVPPVVTPERLPELRIYQLTTCLFEESEMRRFRQAFPDFHVTQSSPNWHDVTPPGGGKHRGIEAVCRHYGFAQAQTMAFGDGHNDSTMLAYAGIGVAMGGCLPGLEQHADWKTTGPEEDGIRLALEHFEVI